MKIVVEKSNHPHTLHVKQGSKVLHEKNGEMLIHVKDGEFNYVHGNSLEDKEHDDISDKDVKANYTYMFKFNLTEYNVITKAYQNVFD